MRSEQLLIPGSIVLAGLMIAGGILLSQGGTLPERSVVADDAESFANSNSGTAANVMPVDLDRDHVFGNPNAKVTIIEYSDFECPFCSRAHPTLKQVVAESGGDVNWIYRHFPLTNIHPRAARAAYASECAAELAGNDAFWAFTDVIFEQNASLSDDTYRSFATSWGIDPEAMIACIDSERFEPKIAEDMQNAVQSGGRGTPFMIILSESGQPFPFSGALPYEQMSAIVAQALAS